MTFLALAINFKYMSSSSWIIGLVPLLAFAILDSFFGLKTGLIAALVLAIAECVWTWISFGELDQISIVSLALIIILGALAWKKKSPIIFKIQPSLISFFLGAWLIISWSVGEPVFVAMIKKYAAMLPIDIRQNIQNPQYLAFISLTTLTTGVGMLFHAFATGYAAFKLSNWWWIAVRGIGFYLFAFISMLCARIMIN